MSLNLGDDNEESIMAEINMTPLIDVMLVLLIIFMVTSSVSLDSGMDIDLPEVASKPSANEGGAVIISLSKDGQISIQGKITTLGQLQERVAKALKAESTNLVILEGDRASYLGSAVEIMDLAKRAGAIRFAIAADQAK